MSWWIWVWMGCTPEVAPTPTEPTSTAPSGTSGDTAVTPTVTGPEPLLAFDGDRPQNLLMISIDTLRRDQLTRYGGKGNMPFLDQLLEEGVGLDDHVACSNWTLHSTVCAMTGTYPELFGYLSANWRDGVAMPPPNTPMLASFLGEDGFHSVFSTGNRVFSSAMNNAVGFDEEVIHEDSRQAPALEVAAAALEMMGRQPSGARHYAHMHLMDPHLPYNPPSEYLAAVDALAPIPYDLTLADEHLRLVADILDGTLDAATAELGKEHIRLRYDADAHHLDDQLSQIWADLDASGALDDTLVVVWTDHGEQHFEHGLQGHANTLHRAENDAVLFFWSRNLPAQRFAGPTSMIDMVPTVLGALEVAAPTSVTGLQAGTAPSDRIRYAGSVNAAVGIVQSVVSADSKLHFQWQSDEAHGATQFARSDLAENNDQFDPTDPTTQALWDALLPMMRLSLPLTNGQPPTLPPGLPEP